MQGVLVSEFVGRIARMHMEIAYDDQKRDEEANDLARSDSVVSVLSDDDRCPYPAVQ